MYSVHVIQRYFFFSNLLLITKSFSCLSHTHHICFSPHRHVYCLLFSGFTHLKLYIVANQASLEHFFLYVLTTKDIVTNARAELQIKSPTTGLFLELDVWLPNLQLGFEFQDIYHFTTAWYRHTTLSDVHNNDDVKRDLFMRAGITLITVPCWWDIKQDSLVALIKFERPDLMGDRPEHSSALTPLNPKENYWPPLSVPDVGEVMLASFNVSSSRLTTNIAKDPWWLGEKYDGIHFIVNPTKENIFNRRGQDIPVTQSIIDLGTNTSAFLDGELWFGRKTFHESQLIYRDEVGTEQWSFLRMIAFDYAAFSTQHEPYETRYQYILDSLSVDYPVYMNAFRLLCTSTDVLKSVLKEIIGNSVGEGIILQRRRSIYQQGRSSSLFKIKALRGDSEALVQKVTKIFVEVQLAAGQSVRIPKANIVEGLHLKGGDIVTLEYDTVFREVPVDPVIARVRSDTLWDNIVDESTRASTNKDVLSKALRGYWKTQDGATARHYFVDFAMKRGLDPLLPATWYSLSYTTMVELGASLAYMRSRGGYVETLMDIFPNIGLDPRRFCSNPNFTVVQNRRKLFDNYAKEHSFNPLVEQNWYAVDMKDLLNAKGARIVARYYGGIKIALRHLYPELNMDATKYAYQADFYTKTVRRREVFNEFAAANRFDPLIPENWYSIARDRIMLLKNSTLVRNFYQRQVIKALMDVYPDIGLERTQFIHISSNFWAVVKNRKAFFDEFAKENGFDSLIATNWYNVPRHKLVAKKGAFPVLGYYNKNYARALMSLYPNIGLELDKFGILPGGHWNEIQNRREFFDNFALSHGFDPLVPQHWYPVTQQQVLETKYSRIVLGYYKGSFVNALLSLYPRMGLDKFKFTSLPREFWGDRVNRREFFDVLAQANGFDPLVASNWYSLPKIRIHERKGASYIATLFDGNELMAIIDAYPELNLEEKKFEFLPLGYWVDERNRRAFFDSFAKANNFDPLVADNWHKTKRKNIMHIKHARSVLAYYNGSYVNALTSIYPDIGINRNNFMNLPGNYWKDPLNRRGFFDSLAKKHGFDPLTPENWYKVTGRQIRGHKGGDSILAFYNDQVGEALLQLYPDIGLQRARLKFSEGIWFHSENRRQAFNSFAKQRGFDPLVAHNWYSVGKKDFLANAKGAISILSYYQNSFIRSLVEIYPDIGLDIHKFAVHRGAGGYWLISENRRRFFDEYAQKHNFDPLNAEAWHQVSRQSICETKYSDNVLKYYRYSVANALLHLYPNIGLDVNILSRPRDYWKRPHNRKEFFDDYARKNSFDPLVPHNWYQVSQHKIREQRDAMNVLGFYNDNFVVALLKLYPDIGLDISQFSKDFTLKPNTLPFAKQKFDPSLAAISQLFPEIGAKQTL